MEVLTNKVLAKIQRLRGPRFLPLQPLVIGFVAIVCVALVGSDVLRVSQDRVMAIRDSNRDTGNLARAVDQHADDVFLMADGFLNGFVERIEHDGTGAEALARLNTIIPARLKTLQGVSRVMIVDARGVVLMASAPTSIGLNLADRAYFTFHRDNPSRATHFGHPVRDRTTGEWLIPLTRRLNNPDGSFAGVVGAVLNTDYFQRFYATFDIGQHGSISLALSDGTLLVRRPFESSRIGTDLSNDGLFRAIPRQGPIGSLETYSQTDGLTRFNSYRKLDAYPLVVAVAREKNEVLAPWRARAVSDISADLSLAAVIALFGLVVARQTGITAAARHAAEGAKAELEAANRQLEILATHDVLTGIANRRHFDEMIEAECRRAQRESKSLSLIMIDIDFFKRYNDRYGHLAGDECLRTIASTIGHAIRRAGDTLARYGGEEFAVLLPNTSLAGAVFVAEQIRAAVRALGITHADHPNRTVSVSLGVATLSPDQSPDDLIAAADRMLYAAKENGRDTVRPHPLARQTGVLLAS